MPEISMICGSLLRDPVLKVSSSELGLVEPSIILFPLFFVPSWLASIEFEQSTMISSPRSSVRSSFAASGLSTFFIPLSFSGSLFWWFYLLFCFFPTPIFLQNFPRLIRLMDPTRADISSPFLTHCNDISPVLARIHVFIDAMLPEVDP